MSSLFKLLCILKLSFVTIEVFRLTLDVIKESEKLLVPPMIGSYRRSLVNDLVRVLQ